MLVLITEVQDFSNFELSPMLLVVTSVIGSEGDMSCFLKSQSSFNFGTQLTHFFSV